MENIITATIPAGTPYSNIIDLSGYKFFKIHMPSAWTEAALSVESCPSELDTIQKTTDDAGTETSIASTVALANVDIVIKDLAIAFASMTRCRLVSGTSASTVNQAADRVIKIVAKT